jgi:hypothetical protein
MGLNPCDDAVEYDDHEGTMTLSLEAYAQLMAELVVAGDAREAVLSRHGLTEAQWDAIDAVWQSQLSAALDADDDGVPAIVSAYAAAYEAAQRTLAPPISLPQFARVTRLLNASGDLRAALAKVGVSLAEYTGGSEHWCRRMAEAPALERRFHDLVSGRVDDE